MEEPLPPPTDDLKGERQALRNLLVLHPGSSQENDLGPDHFTVR